MRRSSLRRMMKSVLKQNNKPDPLPLEQNEHSSSNEKFLGISLSDNIEVLKAIFSGCSDVIFREFVIGREPSIPAVLIWTDGLSDKTSLNVDVLRSLMQQARLLGPNGDIGAEQAFPLIRDGLLSMADIKEEESVTKLVDAVLIGEAAIIIDQFPSSLIISTRSWESRDVAEPVTEGVVRGPRQGFTENLRTNTSLIRRIIKTPQLKMETLQAGKVTKTDIIVAYVQGIADHSVVEEVKRRIQKINIDAILESAYVEEMIEDHPYSPFPQIVHTERPDKVSAELLEGRVAILVDGTPFVLVVPTVFVQFLQSSEDYYERYPMAFAIRAIRYLFFALALLLPSAYIAATTYHQEMLPTSLLISIAGSREGVPFPGFIEALLMEITFEALREAGVRLPKPVGQAVSIVGALVIGEAAVQAGIVSPAMVIVVAVTAIASFTIPAFNVAITIRMIRFPMMVLAAVLGFYGISLGILMILIHLCSMHSFGVPYFAPIGPFQLSDMKDVMLRMPWWFMRKRPLFLGSSNQQREDTPKPEPPKVS